MKWTGKDFLILGVGSVAAVALINRAAAKVGREGGEKIFGRIDGDGEEIDEEETDWEKEIERHY